MDYIHLGKELNNFKHIILPSYPTNKPSLPIAKKPLMIISAGKRMLPLKVKTKDIKTKNQYTPNTPITYQHQKNQEGN